MYHHINFYALQKQNKQNLRVQASLNVSDETSERHVVVLKHSYIGRDSLPPSPLLSGGGGKKRRM